ncbi:MAG TPA: DUF6057 family protein [Prolixibacteraceae bacterium]|nr:DUF6057 family protein [Prolixibacteraceae bacterium]
MKFKILNLQNCFILFSILAAWWFTAVIIEPFLHYHFQQTGFLTTFGFFHGYAVNAGGIADYTAEFIAQFFSFNLWGSLLIVTVAALQGLITMDLITRMKGKTNLAFSAFALVFLLGVMVVCDYRYPYYVTIRLLFAFLFTWGFYLLKSKYSKISIYTWPLLASLLFYLASGPALFVFTLSSILMLATTERASLWIKASVAYLLITALLPYIGYKFIFQSTLMNLYRITVVKPPEMLAYITFYQLFIYYALLPLLLAVFLFLIPVKKQPKVIQPKKGKNTEKIRVYKKPVFILSFQAATFAGISYALFIYSHEPLKKNLLTIEYYAEAGDWHKVLKTAEDISSYDFKVNFHVNRAYAHLGKLSEQLFNYPQLLGINGLLLDNSNMNGSFTMPNSDLYYDLGFMSESQRWAFESQTLMPNNPRILKRLVMINLINRKYDLAEQFLNVLDKNMLYHDWVDQHRRFVTDTALTNTDKTIAEKRKFNPQKRYVHINALDDLKLLFETNSTNRFAYDYLISYCILESNMNDFIKYIPYYTSYNLKTLPRSWAETLSIYILRNKTIPPFMTDETISKECMQKLMKFNTAARQFNNNLPAGQEALRNDFEDTYWYYMLYLDPKVTKVLNYKAPVI